MRRLVVLITAIAAATSFVAVPASAVMGTASQTHEVTVYFLSSQPSGAGPYLVPAHRTVTADTAIPAATVQALLAGPSATEQAAGLTTAVPAGTTLHRVHLDNGIATVDLSAQYASGGGSASMFGRLAQVAYTLTRFPTIDGVRFALDGAVVTTFSGEGLLLPNPVTRAYFTPQSLEPPIFLDRPAWGAPFGHRVAGTTSVTGGAFTVEVSNAAGAVLASQPVTAVAGLFDVNVPYQVTTDQPGTITVYSGSTTARQNVRTYPVTLLAGSGGAWVRGVSNACTGVPPQPFADVPGDSPHGLGIAVAHRWGVVNGTSTTTYAPLRLLNREQVAAMVARMLQGVGVVLPADPGHPFTDVSGSPFRLQIEQLAQLQVMYGYGDGTFGPAGPVTRAQVMAMLQRAYELRAQTQLAAGPDVFSDDQASPHHAAINAMAAVGVAGGYGDGTFGPSRQLTREQVATMLARTLDLFVTHGLATAR